MSRPKRVRFDGAVVGMVTNKDESKASLPSFMTNFSLDITSPSPSWTGRLEFYVNTKLVASTEFTKSPRSTPFKGGVSAKGFGRVDVLTTSRGPLVVRVHCGGDTVDYVCSTMLPVKEDDVKSEEVEKLHDKLRSVCA
jgi:hypothetical protein